MKSKFWLVAFILLLNCTSRSPEKIKESYIVIDQGIPSINDVVDLPNFITINKVISLETTDSSLIDFVHKVVEDEFYFVQGGKSVYKFDKSGEFISKISKGKGGPDEFVNLTDILTLNDKDRLWVYDSHARTIFQFDYNFNLEINYTLDYPLFGLEKLENGLIGTPGYMLVLEDPYSLFYFQGDNLEAGYKFEKTLHPFDLEKSDYLHVMRHDFFSELESGGYNYVNSFNDTIYHISKTGDVYPSYFIDFGNKKVLETDLTEKGYTSIVDVFQFINSTDKSFNVGNVFESNKFLIYRFFNQGKAFLSVYDKSTGKLVSGHRIKLDNIGKSIELPLDEEIRIGSFGDGRGYLVLPSESSVLGEFQKEFGVVDGDNPLLLVFNEK
ncbi:MAG TPA: hypothetical protein DEQ87_07445 [Algoriphagus sp.]|jgi:hypothetical protein|uniref:6-bladed beta-propeller n=1 Tax=unclassified Algoriphagus TaxID=2641541 RepID=UPI000C4C0D24|nr:MULTISPECIES: 6-bladed beta-propeller [unclassified Algoriphagus]MAL13092.1 hypothetical protein [Algoriphagus sp.]QYH41031.1 6-bladed beta-propeller [Algoriphagus sp. NBT04N3]HAH35759.1 hypothetical protein [Algoriphagus sp.]HAS58600.1 hypothetical protein [Algoriphagus sp.]HCD87460.1 hypothetical protein [Algoriphagus sp.]|tara:strand:- start:328 stop:1476 length:1149 start_codon:yes stop_codon:yes gene_type:complete